MFSEKNNDQINFFPIFTLMTGSKSWQGMMSENLGHGLEHTCPPISAGFQPKKWDKRFYNRILVPICEKFLFVTMVYQLKALGG